MARRIFGAGMLISLALPVYAFPARAAGESAAPAIVLAVDSSGSMASADRERYWADAEALGAGLAPEGARVAYLASNYEIVAQTALLDTGLSGARSEIKAASENTVCRGYTDFNAALKGALDILSGSDTGDRHIFFIADASEGGYDLSGVSDYTGKLTELDELGRLAAAENVEAHLIFLGVAARGDGNE